MAGTRVLGRLRSRSSFQQVGRKTTLEDKNVALVALNTTSRLSAVLLSPRHLCLELAVRRCRTFILLAYVLTL